MFLVLPSQQGTSPKTNQTKNITTPPPTQTHKIYDPNSPTTTTGQFTERYLQSIDQQQLEQKQELNQHKLQQRKDLL
jgi:hypothetical protein